MKDDTGQKTYYLLEYFYNNERLVHFKLLNGNFRNGLILDLSIHKQTLILKERVLGTIPIMLEEIKADSIQEFTEKSI